MDGYTEKVIEHGSRIVTLEKQNKDLYEKYDTTKDLLAEANTFSRVLESEQKHMSESMAEVKVMLGGIINTNTKLSQMIVDNHLEVTKQLAVNKSETDENSKSRQNLVRWAGVVITGFILAYIKFK